MKTITRGEIILSTELSSKARLWAYDTDNLAYLNKPMKLFGSSTKVEKGSDKRDTYIMYLQPAGKVSRATLCDGADAAGCEAPCLISSGQLGMSTGQRAATKRTILFLLRPADFYAQLSKEIEAAERKAERSGIPALFRLNGTSDIDWGAFIAAHPDSAFYDYTKVLSRMRKNTLANYDLTFSGSMYSTASKSALRKALARDYKTVVAVNSKLIASDAPVLRAVHASLEDFDATDLRPLDAAGSLGVLKRKGGNKAGRAAEDKLSASFFITSANYVEFIDIVRGV